MRIFRIVTFLIAICFFISSNAQYTQNANKEIVIGVADSLYSDVLNEQREIWIHLPNAYNTAEKYPVIYVLDTRHNFYSVVGMLNRLLPWRMPKSIVVGIKNTDRSRDFTPTNVPFNRGKKSETSGGADNFIKFVNQELKPFVNSKYATENLTTVVGHSLGGLFVLHTFLNDENTFDNYVAIDPSLWWDKENLVNNTQKQLDKKNLKNKSLYIAVANSIGKNMDTVKVRKEKSVVTEQIRANLKFHDILEENRKNLDFEWEYFKNEDHGSVVIPAQFKGLRSVFSWFPFPEQFRFNTPKLYSVDEMIQPYYKHYKSLSLKMKREVKPSWALVNDIGLFMLEQNFNEKALAFYQMNLDFHPDNSGSYTALGNYYLLQKDKEIAISYYEKAVKIGDNTDAKQKLQKLKSKN